MNKELTISHKHIQNRIYSIRDTQVMIDFHLADLYNVETKRINEQVKRNSKRFPEKFMFQLTKIEWEQLQSQIATTENDTDLRSQFATTKRRTLPYVFTEQGIAMLSAVLHSDMAIMVSIHIMDAFVNMRKILLESSLINHRLNKIELEQLQTEQKFEQVFKALENKDVIPTQGVFFDGQIFDAYELISKIIKTAQKSIVLIDNYIDESTLIHLSKKQKNISVLLLTKNINKQLQLDVKKVNAQYGNFELKPFDQSHDRFMIIDKTTVFHLGASLKDLGKKWFAFSKMDKNSVNNMINSIEKLI